MPASDAHLELMKRDNFIAFFSDTCHAKHAEVKLWPLFQKAINERSVDAALDLFNRVCPGQPIDLWLSTDRTAISERATVDGMAEFGYSGPVETYECAAHLIAILFLSTVATVKQRNPAYLRDKPWPKFELPFPHRSVISSDQINLGGKPAHRR